MFVVKSVWLGTVVTIWLMGLGSCLTEPQCWLAEQGFLPFVFMFSFPGSLLFLIVNSVLLNLGLGFDVAHPLSYSYFGLGSIAVGYVQWFHVIPALFGKQKLTILSLRKTEVISPVTSKLQLDRPKAHQAVPPKISAFDKTGRSPLERAMNHPRGKLTSAS